jgi:hypothetical protein
MSATSPEPLGLLERAAELRARGRSWDEAAARLSLGHDELRKLVADHTRDYGRLERRARADVLQATRHLALRTLRELMASPEDRVRMVATTTFVRYDLALKRHGDKEAESRLERDTSPHKRDRTTGGAGKTRDKNMSESSEVKNQQDVAAPKNVAQTTAPKAATPAAKPAPAATQAAAQAKPTAPIAAQGQVPPEELARRRRLLLNDFTRGGAARPLGKADRLDQEVGRLVDGLLGDGK